MDKVEKSQPVKIVRNKISGILLLAGGLLILAYLTTHVFKYGYEHLRLLGFTRLLDFNQLGSFPHYFISLLLLISSFLLYLIAISHKSEGSLYWIHWSVLSFVFFILSFYKLLWVREISTRMLENIYIKSDISYSSWVILKVTLLVLFVALFLRFFLQLPSRVKLLFFVAVGLLIGGGLGVDTLSHMTHNWHTHNLTHMVMSTVEESMVMLGIIVFIHALLGYLAEYAPRKAFIITNR